MNSAWNTVTTCVGQSTGTQDLPQKMKDVCSPHWCLPLLENLHGDHCHLIMISEETGLTNFKKMGLQLKT